MFGLYKNHILCSRVVILQEMETNEKLRIQLRQQELTIEGMEKVVDAKKKQAADMGEKKGLRSSWDGKDYRAAVVGKILEDKNKILEEENEKKVSGYHTLSIVKQWRMRFTFQ